MKPKITLTIHTASFDSFMQNQGIDSYFDAVTHSLTYQTFKDFEFILIDTFHEENKDKFAEIIAKLPFQVKHVPVHHNHRYWFDLGHTYIAAAKNTGILYADGELVVVCDDGEFFPDDFLQRYWQYYEGGHLMHAYHKRMRSIKTENGRVVHPIEGDFYINDSRLANPDVDVQFHVNGTWTYAGTSFALNDALRLNGFNEHLDGCKSVDDCDFGIRLTLLGRKLVIDRKGCLYILDHLSYVDAPRKKEITDFIAVENYGTLRCASELFELEANKTPITKRHLEIIQRETIKYRFFDPLADANKEKLAIWLKTPMFNLKTERAELRHSSNWKW